MKQQSRLVVRILGSLCAAIAVALTLGFTPALAVSVSSDPIVIIAQDTTASSACMMSVTTSTTKVSYPCPDGSVIGTAHVRLSQARAEQEAYVMLPSGPVSPTTKAQIMRQIYDLMVTKGQQSRQHSSTTTLSPFVALSYCYGEYEFSNSWRPSFDNNTVLYSWVVLETNGNCNSIEPIESHIQGGILHSPTYWDHDQYAANSWDWGCPQITTSDRTEDPTPYYYQAAGYYWQQYVSSGSWCTPFDNYSYINIGPLSPR